MPKKEDLITKLLHKPIPTNFTIRELDQLMSKCGCKKYQGGRGSGIGYNHIESGRDIQCDEPHPGNELYRYQIKMVISFLKDIGEI